MSIGNLGSLTMIVFYTMKKNVKLANYIFAVMSSSAIMGCGFENSTGAKSVIFLRNGYGTYEMLMAVWPVGVLLLSFILMRLSQRYVEKTMSLLVFYISGNVLSYQLFSQSSQVGSYGVYLNTCLYVLVTGVFCVVVWQLIDCVKKRKRCFKKLLSNIGLFIVVLFVCSWLSIIYRLGAGECFTIGRSLTTGEVIRSMSQYYLENKPKEEWAYSKFSHENLVRSGYEKFVQRYLAEDYLGAIELLPYQDFSPSGKFHFYYDDFFKRILRGTSYRLFEIDVEGPGQLPRSVLVSNCGEVQPVSTYLSKRPKLSVE